MHSEKPCTGRVIELIYELLDAHDDTTQLASSFTFDPAWSRHLEYLRCLQRAGREILAGLALTEMAGENRDDRKM